MFFVIFLSFFLLFSIVYFLSFFYKDWVSGEGGKPGLGNTKNAGKIPPQKSIKKYKKHAKKGNKMTRMLVKLRFWRLLGPGPPSGPFHPGAPTGFWAGPAPRETTSRPGRPKTNSLGQAPLPYPSSPPAGFPRVSALVPCIWCCHEITKGLLW